MSTDSQALEYVLGTLPEGERRALERAMARDVDLAAEVRFWEEQLMVLQNPDAGRAPDPEVWQRIEQRITRDRQPARRRYWWGWGAAALAMVLLVALPFLELSRPSAPALPNTDYVAVLTDDQGQARLTAMTLAEGESLWLQWESIRWSDEHSLQLWAVSRRDGQTRPLAVFDRAEDVELVPLDQARRRLIADAEYLLLTEEPPGGSPLDEPSERQVARGVCVRVSS